MSYNVVYFNSKCRKLSAAKSGRWAYFKSLALQLVVPLRLTFLPRDATQSAVMPQYIVCPSVSLSVCDVEVCFSNWLEYFENNFTAE